MKAGKIKNILIVLVMLAGLFMVAAAASASPSAGITHTGTDLGGGWWQHDYSISNTSSANEYIYGLLLSFDTQTQFNGISKPSSWKSMEGSPLTTFAMTYSPSLTYDIAPSGTANASFKLKNYTGDIDYKIFFDDHNGQRSVLSGTTQAPIAPEPVSSVLFIIGGATLGGRILAGRKR